jgi:hypothetical protein
MREKKTLDLNLVNPIVMGGVSASSTLEAFDQ